MSQFFLLNTNSWNCDREKEILKKERKIKNKCKTVYKKLIIFYCFIVETNETTMRKIIFIHEYSNSN